MAIQLIFGKTLNGRQLKDKEFNFVLKEKQEKFLKTVQNDAKGKVTFSTINYGRDDLGKTFNYTVKEVVPTTAEAGMSYDQMEAKVASYCY